MRKTRVAAGLVAWLALASGAAAAPAAARRSVTIMAEDAAPPWSNPDGSGYANETVRAAFAAMGVDAVLEVVPYARCKGTVLAGKVAGCFSIGATPELDHLVTLAKEPLIFLNADVFERTAKPLPRDPAGGCRLPAGTKVAVVRRYEYPPQATALIAHGVTVERTASDDHSLKMLAAGRLDAAVIITNDIEPRSAKAAAAGVADKVRFAFNCGQETGTIGFSVKHPDGPWAAVTYEAGYRKIAENGTLARIRKREGHHH